MASTGEEQPKKPYSQKQISKSNELATTVKITLMGVGFSGKSTTFFQIYYHINKGLKFHNSQKDLTSLHLYIAKIWASVIDTATNIINFSDNEEVKKDGKSITDEFTENNISATYFMKQNEHMQSELLDVTPQFKKIISLYKNHDSEELIKKLRANSNLYFDGME